MDVGDVGLCCLWLSNTPSLAGIGSEFLQNATVAAMQDKGWQTKKCQNQRKGTSCPGLIFQTDGNTVHNNHMEVGDNEGL